MKDIFYFFAILAIALCTSCTEDEPVVSFIDYSDGVFITNEGAFTGGTGTITFKRDDSDAVQNVYANENNGKALGNVLQSMLGIDDQYFFIINNANKIEVANQRDLVSTATIDGIDLPRYMVNAGDDKAYVSYWGPDGLSGGVAIVDLNNLSVSSKIETYSGPENMTIVDDALYVTIAGGFGRATTLLKIDINTDTVVNTIELHDNPNSIVVDADNDIWVLCGGYTDFNDASNNTPGKLIELKDDAINKTFDVATGSNNLGINPEGDVLYYLDFAGVHKFTSGATPPNNSIIFPTEGFLYGLDVRASTGMLYIVNANDFVSAGEVIVIDDAGTEIERIQAGIIPNGCYFND